MPGNSSGRILVRGKKLKGGGVPRGMLVFCKAKGKGERRRYFESSPIKSRVRKSSMEEAAEGGFIRTCFLLNAKMKGKEEGRWAKGFFN